MNEILTRLKQITKEENILIDEPMAKHTTFLTGGKADFYVLPETKEEVIQILKTCSNVTVLGNGSNILVTDKGIRGVTMSLRKLNQYTVEQNQIIADCGVPIAKLSRIAAENGLSGLEFACGIPGTLGGAVFMNAGAYGGEMKDVVVSSSYIDTKDFLIKEMHNHEFVYRGSVYASSKAPGIIVSATLRLQKGEPTEIMQKIQANMASRKEKQPIGYPSAGSTFKRKEGVIAAKLIDEAGLKGYQIGGAAVSTLHAGFVINTGKATSKDILDLIEHIQKVVKEKYGVELEREIKVIGEQ